ncbi:Protein of unknown function DUF935 [uncultured Caudovirales phage]|uniref:DUF935 family protein n=1 Tax=uncultured Caudovirales phage TaxID=2100421 RepID=A0A6J5L0R5_9CAUD|nr:Protein of unknown function DUF935 [uncultured Caudovirales phage]
MANEIGFKKERPENANIYNTIPLETQLFRVRQDIGKLRLGLLIAENVQRPQRYQLLQTYKDAMLDAHLTACVENRINLTMSRQPQFLNADGSVNEEYTKILKTKWFNDFQRYVLETPYYGYSVIQFGDLTDKGFSSSTLIPRQYVKPEFHLVTETYSGFSGNDWREEPYKWWCIGVGDEKDLGLLKQASIYAIYKKNALGAWAEFCEVFGVPIRLGKTDITDPVTRQNMENFLKNMGVSSYAVVGKNDLIEIVESNRADAFQVFDQMINRCNTENSKLILGSTGLMDEKAHVGAASVHNEVSLRFQERDEHLLENCVNTQLIPILEYHGIIPKGLTFEISDVEDIDLTERAKVDIALLNSGKYTIPADYILETYGTPVVEVKDTTDTQRGKTNKDIANELKLFYP